MPNRRVEDEIERLSRLREAGPGPGTVAAVRKAVSDRVGLVVAKAAKMAAELELRELIPDLLRAFDRMFENPVERDPQCWAKNAIAKALTELDFRESAPYLRGVRHVQMEAVWGFGSTGVFGKEDTAPTLRGICLLGLIPCADVRREVILRHLVDGLTDHAQTVRVEAVRALAEMGGDESALLLRLKARAGDVEPPVIGQTFDSLLRLEGTAAIPFLADFLRNPSSDVQAEAALALGSSRMPEAVEALENAWHGADDPALRETLVRAISAARQERGFAFLLELVKNGRSSEACSALEALALHRESPEIWRRVEEAVNDAGTAVQARFQNFTASGG